MDELIAQLDQWLTLASARSMFTADEVCDMLLDFRGQLTGPQPEQKAA